MSTQNDKRGTTESFGDIFRAFGEAISRIFNDPELKEQDEEVRAKFREVGQAAQDLGKSIADRFRDEKDS
jgi:hypothetical protein